MNDTDINKIDTAIEYLVKADAQPEYIIEMVKKLYDHENIDYTIQDLTEKVYSSLTLYKGQTLKGRISLQSEVMDFVTSVTTGSVLLLEIYNSLHLQSKNEKAACRMAVKRLVELGTLEPCGNRSGVYRKVDKRVETIDFMSAKGEMLDLKWPFGIEKLCGIMPKNIIVVTGSPDTGKTAFLLDFIRRNMEKWPINYFSSESGPLELRSRLEKFPQLPLEGWKFKPFERSSNFADVIKPDEINVIDFLEIHQDFFLIGQWIKDIFDKLNKGIAVIAIQKNTGKGVDIARGGVGSLEKPRLYISLSNNPHTLKIVKAKNWVNDMINPNGLFMRYKIVGGCQFRKEKNAMGADCDWEKENVEPEETKTLMARRV
jgi:hypothetical protein